MTKNDLPADGSEDGFVADSLATGMAVMLGMTIVQRGLGFFRGLWFCGSLDDSVVGEWSMAYDFIIMMTPVMLLGLPGSLPRYAEHYRIRGHLHAFTKRVLLSTALLGLLSILGMGLFPQTFGWLVFLESENIGLVYAVATSVLAVAGFNFVYQLVSSLRQVRVASIMQFVQSVGFTILAVGWLSIGGGVMGMIYAFALASALSMLLGFRTLYRGWSSLPVSTQPFEASKMWRRLLPYAAALWAMNLLTNTFTMSDRYMILHLMPGSEETTKAAVGQYHSGRILPMLMVSVASMAGGILMPYLTADWEAGDEQGVRDKLRRILFAVSALFTAAAGVVLLLSPWFFETMLQNRYEVGLTLLPMTFVFCIWISLGHIGQDYLWIAERGKLVALVIAAGFAVNLVMNYFLLPLWGVHGAVVATLVSNGLVLSGFWWAMCRCGYSWDQTTFALTILPMTLLISPWLAIVFSIVVSLGLTQSRNWIAESLEEITARLAKFSRPKMHQA